MFRRALVYQNSFSYFRFHSPALSPRFYVSIQDLHSIKLKTALQVLALCPVRPHIRHVTVLLGLCSADDWILFYLGRPRLFVSTGGFNPSFCRLFWSTGIVVPL